MTQAFGGRSLWGTLFITLQASVLGAPATSPMSGPGFDMDYGSLQSYTISESHRASSNVWDNLVTKGVAIRLGTNAAVLFDTELMRYAAGWTGTFLDLSETHLTTSKGSLHARISGEVQVRTAPGPGWAKEGRFADPRPSGTGSMPRDWAHYRGLYRHQDRVVLHYEVGGVAVWDLPAYESAGKHAFFTRTVHVDGSEHPLDLAICDLDEAADGSQAERTPDGRGLRLRARSGRPTVFVGVSQEAGSVVANSDLLRLDGKRIYLHWPAHAQPATIRVSLWRGAADVANGDLIAAFDSVARVHPKDLCRGGPSRWPQALTTPGRKGFGAGPYVVDSVTVPESNPWKSWMRLLALDFFADGRAAVSTWNGDVWIVSGLGEDWSSMTWRRYAAGLFEGLGIKIVDGTIYVLERHQITRLHDLDQDGEADYYENFNNDAPIGASYHAFSFGLETDSHGSFYFTRCGHRIDPQLPFNGGLMRVSKDGRSIERVAHGMRAPSGLSVGPHDQITTADNQGNWTPTSRIDLIKPGGFYGFVPHAHTESMPTDYEKPICWVPYTADNSSAGQVWVQGQKWGLPEGHLLHLSYGKGTLFEVMLDEVGGQVQGASMVFPLRFESGLMRGRFHPKDGQLYVVGLKGWQTTGVRDGALQRVRYTGKPLRMPLAFHVVKGGVEMTFSEELDAASASDTENYAVEQWNYLWSDAYGSPEFSVAQPERKGRDPVEVRSAELLPDGRTVRLRLDPLIPVMQMRIAFKIKDRSGVAMAGEIYPTINRVP